MSDWRNDWKGTTAEINDLVEYYIDKIMNNYNVDNKTAKKYLCESLSRNVVVAEVEKMLDYLVEERAE